MTITQSMMLSLKSLKHSARPQLESGWQRWLSISLGVWGCAAIAVTVPIVQAAPKSAGVVINGSKEFDFSGRSVSNAGDVNGDRIPDVLVGADSADPHGKYSAGRSYVVFGKRNTQPVELSSLESGTSQAGFVINGSMRNDCSGRSVSNAGDVNGDSLADVIVSANCASPNGKYSAGRSYVVFGKRNTQPVELSSLESGTSQTGFVINGSKTGDRSCGSVSKAGDVNGDGLADVIVGALDADPNGQSHAGRSYVVFGKRDVTPVELSSLESGTSQAGFVINGSIKNDYSGRSVSKAGDVNGDGLADVIVGAGRALNNTARGYVVFGKHDVTPVELSSLESGTSQAGFVINGSNKGGFSVSNAGDVNGDGLADVIVGTYRGSPNGKVVAGRSYIVFGRHDVTPIELVAMESGTSEAGFIINGSNRYDYSGFSVSTAGDVNGDGLADIIIGANHASPNGQFQAGRSYVVFGKRDVTPVELSSLESGTSQAGFVINGSNRYDYSGGSVSEAGDVNGDGIPDVIVGADSVDPHGINGAGRSYVVFGKRNTQPVELSTLEGN